MWLWPASFADWGNCRCAAPLLRRLEQVDRRSPRQPKQRTTGAVAEKPRHVPVGVGTFARNGAASRRPRGTSVVTELGPQPAHRVARWGTASTVGYAARRDQQAALVRLPWVRLPLVRPAVAAKTVEPRARKSSNGCRTEEGPGAGNWQEPYDEIVTPLSRSSTPFRTASASARKQLKPRTVPDLALDGPYRLSSEPAGPQLFRSRPCDCRPNRSTGSMSHASPETR